MPDWKTWQLPMRYCAWHEDI